MAGIGIINLIQKVTAPPAPQNLLRFPASGDGAADAYYAIRFTDPHLHGMPIWGPSNRGWTVISERLTRQTTGYVGAGPWWCNGGDFIWKAGDTDSYIGMCPFPANNQANGTTHKWELSGMFGGTDNYTNLAGGTIPVVHDVLRVQGMRITRNANGTKVGRIYPNLPSLTNSNIIEGPQGGADNTGFGETNPPFPVMQLGSSPWTDFDKEWYAGDQGRIKIIAKVLTEADMVLESADMSRLVTADAIANIWWGKTNWRDINDLSDDYGTGITWTWVDAAHKATFIAG